MPPPPTTGLAGRAGYSAIPTLYTAKCTLAGKTPNAMYLVQKPCVCIAGVIGWMGGGRIRAIMTFPLKYEESEPTCGPAWYHRYLSSEHADGTRVTCQMSLLRYHRYLSNEPVEVPEVPVK